MYAKSRTHPEGLPKGLFPHCEVRTCLSECEESHNGPRYSVQERTTGAIYELRCCSLTSMEDDEDSTPAHDKQTQRMEALMQAATHVVNAFTLNMDLSGRRRSTTKVSGTPLCVQLPPVVVEHLDPATGEPYVACLDHFSGLSLGDIARSGWNVVDEQTFFEILAAVEEYGCASPMLPPHGNLSRDAIRQVLVVRDGATEVARSSRWVIADWSLVHHPKLDEPFDPSSFITDVEWMLHSAFAQLSVSCGRDGVTILSPVQVEMAINDTIDHIREALLRVVVAPPPAMPHSASSSSFGDTVNRRLPTYDVLSDNDYDEDEDSILGSSIVVKFDPEMFQRLQRMPVVEKASFHQAELRREQTFINNTKRKTSLNATVVSSSRGSASGRRSPHRAPQLREEFLVNDAEYELLFLTSPIKVQPSYLLTMPADDDSLSSSTVSQSVPSVLSETAELVVSTPTPRTTLESWKASSSRHATLDDVIDLAVLSQERRTQETKANDDDVRIRREALRALLARNAALEASGHLRNRDDDSGVFRERPSARGHPIVALASMRRTFSSDPSLRSRTPLSSRRRRLQDIRPVSGRRDPLPSSSAGTTAAGAPAAFPATVPTKDGVSSSTSDGVPPPTSISRVSSLGGGLGPDRGAGEGETASPVKVKPLPLARILRGSFSGSSDGAENLPPQHSARVSKNNSARRSGKGRVPQSAREEPRSRLFATPRVEHGAGVAPSSSPRSGAAALRSADALRLGGTARGATTTRPMLGGSRPGSANLGGSAASLNGTAATAADNDTVLRPPTPVASGRRSPIAGSRGSGGSMQPKSNGAHLRQNSARGLTTLGPGADGGSKVVRGTATPRPAKRST